MQNLKFSEVVPNNRTAKRNTTQDNLNRLPSLPPLLQIANEVVNSDSRITYFQSLLTQRESSTTSGPSMPIPIVGSGVVSTIDRDSTAMTSQQAVSVQLSTSANSQTHTQNTLPTNNLGIQGSSPLSNFVSQTLSGLNTSGLLHNNRVVEMIFDRLIARFVPPGADLNYLNWFLGQTPTIVAPQQTTTNEEELESLEIPIIPNVMYIFQ